MKSTKVLPTIIEFVTDPQLLGLEISPAQETLLRGVYGLPLSPEQFAIWGACTGRLEYRARPFSEVTVVAGARSGKDSRIAAPILLYEALFGGHEGHLAKGERGILPLVAQDAKATRIAFGYVKDYLTRSPILASQIDEERPQRPGPPDSAEAGGRAPGLHAPGGGRPRLL